MSDNEIDDITREFRQLGHAAASAVAQWQRNNPGKTKVPRKVRKDAAFRLRHAMREHERMLAEQRAHERFAIEEYIGGHRYNSLTLGQADPGTPERHAQRQWAHAQRRHDIAQQIHSAQHLTLEERGQAVMALTSAHYADNPNVPDRPVWGPKPRGISALKARLAERVSRAWEGMQQPQQRTTLKPIPKPRGAGQPRAWAAPGSAADHPYWAASANLPPQDHAMNARMAEMEEQLRELADYREREQRWIAERDALQTEVTDLGEALTDAHTERDQLQATVSQLGEKVLDVRQQHRDVADQLAQRGQELTDAHTELGRVRGERDEAVQKLVKRTPAGQRYGSPERQAEQAKASARKAPETPRPAAPPVSAPAAAVKSDGREAVQFRSDGNFTIPPERRKTPEQFEREAAQFRAGEWAKHEKWKFDHLGPERYYAEKEAQWAEREAHKAPQVTTPEAPEAPQAPQAPEPELVGATAGKPVGKAQRTQRINGSRKVVNTVNEVRGGHTREQIGVVIENGRIKTPSSPEIPLPEAPFDGPEPPEFDR